MATNAEQLKSTGAGFTEEIAQLFIVTAIRLETLAWLSCSYKLVRMLYVCVWMLTRVAQIVTAYVETCSLACTDILMNPDDCIQKLGQSDLLPGQNRPPKKVGVNRHFEASPWDVCDFS